MKVTARDVYGDLLPAAYTVWLERLGTRRAIKVARDVPPDGHAEFETAPSAFYRVRVVSEGHVEVARNVDGSAAALVVAVPVDPSAVIRFEWPDPWPEIPGIVWGRDQTTNDVRRLGTLLNIWAKLRATWFGVSPASSFVDEVLEVRDDRIICRVSPDILGAMAASVDAGDLEYVFSAVGHEPPHGYSPGPSVKTFDAAGNLQVSIFHSAGAGHGPLLAGIDVDEERGFVHAFRAIGHHISGDKTDPIEVQQILAANGIDTGWRPRVA